MDLATRSYSCATAATAEAMQSAPKSASKFISTLVKFFTSFMGFGGKFIGFESSRSHTFCEARCMTTQGTFGFISASSFAGFVPSSVGCLRRSSKDRSRVLPKFSTATLDMFLLQLGWWLQLLRENISWTSSSQSYGCKMVVNQEYVKSPT